MSIRVLLIAAAALAPTLGHTFELRCDFASVTTEQKAATDTHPSSIAFSTSAPPRVVARVGDGAFFELEGIRGTRHFISPQLGGVLAGEFITVLADGRSMRSQHLLQGKAAMAASVEYGHCEVIE